MRADMTAYTIPFAKLGRHDVETVGGKNASLGEMIGHLAQAGVTRARRLRDDRAGLSRLPAAGRARRRASRRSWRRSTSTTSRRSPSAARGSAAGSSPRRSRRGSSARSSNAFERMSGGREIAVAVRSSATAEDLPDASFAGQQETFLNVRGARRAAASACTRCSPRCSTTARSPIACTRASTTTQVALSVGVQHMVRSDLGASGVMFTLDTDSGFRDVVFITASYGLGETVVQGAVNPDEFYVYKPALRAGHAADPAPHARREGHQDGLRRRPAPPQRVATVDVAPEDRRRFSITDCDVIELAQAGAHHRGALRLPDGHRVGQGRRDRQDLHPAGAARRPCRAAPAARSSAYALQAALARARERPRDRPAHRRRPARASFATSRRWRACRAATCWSPT